MKISDILEHAKGRRAKIYTKKPINTIEPKKPEASMNEEDKELGTITAPPGPDGNVQVKTPDGQTTTMPSKGMVAKDDTTQQVPATPGADLVGDKVVQTSEDYTEHQLSNQTAHGIVNGDIDIYDALSGRSGVSPQEMKILQDMYDDIVIDHGYHPDDDFEKIHDYMADRIQQDYGSDIDEVQSPFPSRNDPALAAQAAATQPGHQSVMPSRNAPTKENHGEIGRDAGDAYIADILAQPEDSLGHAHVNERANTFGAKSELEHMLRIAGLR